MKNIVWILVIVLLVFHQDVWLWDNSTIICGFMPIGLAYHVLYSILAAMVWALAVKYAWPEHIERWAEEDSQSQEEHTS